MPDELTFIEKFPEFQLQEVTESDNFLVYKAKENDLFDRARPIIQRAAELMETDANDAVELLRSALDTELVADVDIQ